MEPKDWIALVAVLVQAGGAVLIFLGFKLNSRAYELNTKSQANPLKLEAFKRKLDHLEALTTAIIAVRSAADKKDEEAEDELASTAMLLAHQSLMYFRMKEAALLMSFTTLLVDEPPLDEVENWEDEQADNWWRYYRYCHELLALPELNTGTEEIAGVSANRHLGLMAKYKGVIDRYEKLAAELNEGDAPPADIGGRP